MMFSFSLEVPAFLRSTSDDDESVIGLDGRDLSSWTNLIPLPQKLRTVGALLAPFVYRFDALFWRLFSPSFGIARSSGFHHFCRLFLYCAPPFLALLRFPHLRTSSLAFNVLCLAPDATRGQVFPHLCF